MSEPAVTPSDRPQSAAPLQSVRVWDLPTRVFHWLLAATVLSAIGTAWAGAMAWHFRCGLLALALLTFRLLWGFVGGRWSRFASFVYAPSTVLRYLRGQARPDEGLDVGHTPSGALSVFALLLILIAQVSTGLVADDEIANSGPLSRFAAGPIVSAATSWHKTYGQWIILALVVLHIAAIVWYLVKKRVNLIKPMLHGDKPVPPAAAATPASADGAVQRMLALVLLLACFGLAGWIWGLGNG